MKISTNSLQMSLRNFHGNKLDKLKNLILAGISIEWNGGKRMMKNLKPR